MSGPAATIIKARSDTYPLMSGGDVLPRSDQDPKDTVHFSDPKWGVLTKDTPGEQVSTTTWFLGVCRTVDPREIAGFIVWEALAVLIVVLAVSEWVFFFKYVVEPLDSTIRVRNGVIWAISTLLLLYFRQKVRSRCGSDVRSLMDHAEIFVIVSLVMVFSINIAFYLHVPSNIPLRDLGFMFIPPQSEDSKWRPLSDLMTALLPIIFMLQAYLMTRENRCRVMSSFFRVATIAYALRIFTVPLTSLPGPASHCRPGSPLYHPPESWIDVLTRVGPMYGQFNSCGDLIFSGHMAYTNSAMLLYLRTLDRYFVRYSKPRWLLGILYMVALAVLCISGRKHYSVDVILGLIVSSLVFFHFEHSWIPMCLQHPEALALLMHRNGARHRRGSTLLPLKELDDEKDLDPLERIVIVDDPDDTRLLYRSGKNADTPLMTEFTC
ncbi:hypothetical protein Poli38472_010080 [Pythium oligandrum]|uniref:Sphingomyelin synthase-like domain-containing protein n=1 Tax=Pythium oligandrum TaxID=41045 RepID=A0A8K1C8A7_PYTOL|nr:hypothetical protein Poli38472_010080 [Pythium oligandrum]|eukprot:TMW58521.1 hypothetical protein Poli38472_010080 [Pythium oligandrum]